jgi:HlyD family secretion protein
MSKKWIVAIVVVVVVLVVGYLALGAVQRLSTAQDAISQLGDETAIVRRGTLRVTVDGNGSLAPQYEVGLSFSSSGRVVQVLVEEGEAVAAGQELAVLDTDDLELQVTQAEISLRQAELQMEDLLEPADESDIQRAQDALDQAAASLQLAQINLEGVQNSVALNETLEDAQSEYDGALEEYEYWLEQYNEHGEDHWFVDRAQERLDDAEQALERAQQQADQQMQSANNDLARAYDTYRQAQSDLDILLNGADASQLEQAQLQVDQAMVSLEQAQLRLEQAVLTAPAAGAVTSVNIQVGAMASAGQTAVTLSDLAMLEVEINLDETDVTKVTLGQDAVVTLDAFPESELTGQVTYVASVAQTQSGVVLYPVVVQLAPTDLSVRAGMTADVEIVTLSQENVLIAPLRAIHSDTGSNYVLRQVEDEQNGEDSSGLPAGGFEQVSVSLGEMNDMDVEITEGLEEGDVVSVVSSPTEDPSEFQFGGGPGQFLGGGD